MGNSIDTTTNTALKSVFLQAIEEGVGITEIIKRLQEVFVVLRETRLESILRTEVVKASNKASILGWTQSEIVS
jgi:hypothetical protein